MADSKANHHGSFTGSDVLDFLANYGLYSNGAFTNACVVLFANNPARYIPQIRVWLTEYGDGKTADALLRDEVYEGNLFEPFLFEELPAVNLNAPHVYLREVSLAHIYLGLVGRNYGYRDAEGLSPTEREYDEATRLHKTRLLFLRDADASEREAEMNAFIPKNRAGSSEGALFSIIVLTAGCLS